MIIKTTEKSTNRILSKKRKGEFKATNDRKNL